jgi:DNA polymerase
VAAVRPGVIVCLGATAAQSIMGSSFRVTVDRGRFFETDLGPRLLATAHPSAVLRVPDKTDRERAYADLVADLSVASAAVTP